MRIPLITPGANPQRLRPDPIIIYKYNISLFIDTDTVETTSLLSSNSSSHPSGGGGSSADTIPPVLNTPPPTSTPLQPSLIFQSSFQPHLPGTYLELETKPPKVRSRTQSRTSRTSKGRTFFHDKIIINLWAVSCVLLVEHSNPLPLFKRMKITKTFFSHFLILILSLVSLSKGQL